MPRKSLLIKLGIIALALAVLIAVVASWPPNIAQAPAAAEVWTCSMHPQIRLPAPGQCPICGMKLIPVSQLPSAKQDLEQRAGIETEAIQKRSLFKEIRTVGKLDYSERQVQLITARIAGRVDRLYVDFTGIKVKKNDHLVDIYSPDLFAAQAELIRALEAIESNNRTPGRLVDRFAQSTLAAAREKLLLWGLLPEQIAEIESTRKQQTHITIYAPLGGTVIEKSIRLGQYVKEGDPLYRIADLDPIWLYLDIYEADIAWVRFGQSVDVALEAFPGETLRGTVAFINPFLDDASRTIRVRINLKNPDGRLKPQMYATATIHVPLRADGSPEPTGLEGKYVCPMHPEIVQDGPGKCPICEMALEQVPLLPSEEVAAAQGNVAQVNSAQVNAGHAGDRAGAGASDAELAIPISAVLDTGRRQIAYRLKRDGAYELVELRLGPRAQAIDDSGKRRDYYVVLQGVREGDQVVVQSGFLLDSQRQIEGMPSLLYPQGQAASMSGHAGHAMPAGPEGAAPAAPPAAGEMPAGHKH